MPAMSSMRAWSPSSSCSAMMMTGSRSRPSTTIPSRARASGQSARPSVMMSSIRSNSMPFLGDVIEQLNGMGWGLKNVVCEGAYSQFEVDFDYTTVLGMADRFTFLRILLKEIAKRHGMFVTFMPKPAQGDWRSGAHINWSVQSSANPGKNLFKDEASGGWSDMARWAVGGALKHGVALTAVNCQTVNSYKGLIGRAREFEGGTVTWAPTHITYGVNNRSAMLRFPQARFAIENRAVDMCVNPYLGLAMTCAVSLEGINEQIDPGPPLSKSLYDLTAEEKRKVKPLPRNLDQAIAGFAADPLAKHVFGDTMHRLYTTHKQDEWDRFHEFDHRVGKARIFALLLRKDWSSRSWHCRKRVQQRPGWRNCRCAASASATTSATGQRSRPCATCRST